MKNHLVSIFPLRENDGYARVYLTPLHETGVPFTVPFVITRQQLCCLLKDTSIAHTTQRALDAIDTNNPIQITVTNEDALLLAPILRDAKRA